MELGISPIITPGMLMQLSAGAKIIEVNQNSKETEFEGAIIALFHFLLNKSNKLYASQYAF